jgi:hypothetical protein
MFRQPKMNNKSATIVPKPTSATLIRKARWLKGSRARKQMAAPYNRRRTAVLGAIGIKSAPKLASNGKFKTHPSSARRPITDVKMPAARRQKIRTGGYATRRSSLVTAFISDGNYEAGPVIGNPQISGRRRRGDVM